MGILDIINKILGDPNEKALKRLGKTVQQIRQLQESSEYQSFTLADLPKKTDEFRQRIQEQEESLDSLLPEAFALVCRACELLQGKTMTIGIQTLEWNMVPYDVQLKGGVMLHRGSIAEMRTGEGKTLVCTMPVYLNALTGKGVHVVTVNDYLARRDAQWMGLLYEALGMTVGTIVHGLTFDERKVAYSADITYGTNNEFGFDYLRDNMATSMQAQVQRPLHYAIVDEVDSILIDEARTPLIISQPGAGSTEQYVQYSKLVSALKEHDHFNRDEKQRTATLTEEGMKKVEELLGIDNIYTEKGFETVHHLEQALRAQAIYQRDVDYVVKDGEIIIVDEFTGRLMPGRRYGHGLHQAIEAKENVSVQQESKTLATITFQNFFRLYEKLAGMTGTAKTEAEEFESIYNLQTYVIPTHRPIARDDKPDAIYRTVQAKFLAIAKVAAEKHEIGQPVLIGTTSIEKSEALSSLLRQQSVPHSVLNAKQHEKEAEIVAGAGQKGAVTIATNMAGRGTDIKLGDGVADLGGLAIIGSERHESRRIDNQLRGRSGRQGDRGESQFFVSMEDDLMRLFGGDRMKSLMERLNVPDDMPLQNRIVSRSIESAQKRVEGRNFDIRRHIVRYDDVMNKHRGIIYTRRQRLLEKIEEGSGLPAGKAGIGNRGSGIELSEGPLHEEVLRGIEKEIEGMLAVHAAQDDSETWDSEEIVETMHALQPAFRASVTREFVQGYQDRSELQTALSELVTSFYEQKCADQEEVLAVLQAERVVTLRSIDTHWMQHIDDMAHLREQVAFASMAQRDPLIEYQDQGFVRFKELLAAIDSSIVRTLLQIDFVQFAPRVVLERAAEELQALETNENAIERGNRGSGLPAGKAGIGDRIPTTPQLGGSVPRRPVPVTDQPKVVEPKSELSAEMKQYLPGKGKKKKKRK